MLTTEYERAVLTVAIVADPSKVPSLARLRASDFSEPWYRDLWCLIRAQHAQGKRVDIVQLGAEVQNQDGIGDGRLAEVLDARPEWTNVDQYIEAVIQGSRERRLLAAVETYPVAYRANPKRFRQLLTELRAEVAAVDEGRETETTEAVIDRALKDLQESSIAHISGKQCGIPTGYRCLDGSTGGWTQGLVFVIAWTTGGKTAFLLPSIIAAGNAGHRFRIYSLDMDAASLLLRLAAHRHRIPGSVTSCRAITAPIMDKIGETAAWLMAHGSLSEASMSADELVHDAIAYRDTYDVLFIDTFQSLRIDDSGKRMTPYDRTCYAINRLKELKKIVRKPVICTCQAKDPPDRHEAAKGNIGAGPTLNDAEGARRITQEAQQMIAVWPLEYPATASCAAKIKLAKSQRGIVGSWDCRWDPIIGRFIEPHDERGIARYDDGE